jgi:hypothetical protein
MYAHDDQILDPVLAQKTVDLGTVVGDDVILANRDGGMLASPGLVAFTGGSSSQPPSEASIGNGGSERVNGLGGSTRGTCSIFCRCGVSL